MDWSSSKGALESPTLSDVVCIIFALRCTRPAAACSRLLGLRRPDFRAGRRRYLLGRPERVEVGGHREGPVVAEHRILFGAVRREGTAERSCAGPTSWLVMRIVSHQVAPQPYGSLVRLIWKLSIMPNVNNPGGSALLSIEESIRSNYNLPIRKVLGIPECVDLIPGSL